MIKDFSNKFIRKTVFKIVMERVVKNQLAHWFPVYVWAALIFYFSSSSLTGSGVPSGKTFIIISDYYKHIVAYGFLTFLLWRSFHNSNFRHPEIFAIITATIYGMGTELYQYFVPGRSPSILDMFSNLIGCMIVQPLIILYKRFSKKKKRINF